MKTYLKGIWRARHFWMHLALADLRSKWRRSVMGMLWSILQPLGLTVLLSLVFAKLFQQDFISYAPYVLSGIITWEFISASLTGGALAFVQADAYIKQCRHPLAIYTLRLIVGNLVGLMLAGLALWGWAALVHPENINLSWLAIISFFPVLALMVWPLASLLAYFAVRFRDIPHAMGLILQAIWFVSPVYFDAKMFRRGGLDALIDYNPLYHLLEIVRAPLLEGQWPSLDNYLVCLGTALLFILLAVIAGSRLEPRVIFYL